MLPRRAILIGTLFIFLAVRESENMPNVVKTDKIESDSGGKSIERPHPSIQDRVLYRYRLEKPSYRYLKRQKRNNPNIKKDEENVPRILNKNVNIFSANNKKLQNSVQYFKESSFFKSG